MKSMWRSLDPRGSSSEEPFWMSVFDPRIATSPMSPSAGRLITEIQPSLKQEYVPSSISLRKLRRLSPSGFSVWVTLHSQPSRGTRVSRSTVESSIHLEWGTSSRLFTLPTSFARLNMDLHFELTWRGSVASYGARQLPERPPAARSSEP